MLWALRKGADSKDEIRAVDHILSCGFLGGVMSVVETVELCGVRDRWWHVDAETMCGDSSEDPADCRVVDRLRAGGDVPKGDDP